MDDAGFYATLGVAPSAGAKEVRQAYMRWARELHPDRSDDPAAHERLSRIGEAWAVLRDPALRAVYDRKGRAGLDELSDTAHSDEDDSGHYDSDDSDEASSAACSFFSQVTDSAAGHEPTDGRAAAARDVDQDVAAFFGAGGADRHAGRPSSPRPPRAPPNASASAAAAAPPPSLAVPPPSAAMPPASQSAAAAEPAPGKAATEGEALREALAAEQALAIADAVAEAIRRTEARAARRYERAIANILQLQQPELAGAEAERRAHAAWVEALED